MLEDANIKGAMFITDVGKNCSRLHLCRNWLLAFYSPPYLDKLSLPKDHNKRLKTKDFSGYDLLHADLYKCDLSSANLENAILVNTVLGKANLQGANLFRTNLKGVDLRHTKGLTREQLGRALNVDENLLPDYLKKPQPEKPESK